MTITDIEKALESPEGRDGLVKWLKAVDDLYDTVADCLVVVDETADSIAEIQDATGREPAAEVR